MMARRDHRALTPVLAAGFLLILAGCGRTLVFAEHDGLNLSIRAEPSSPDPLIVNLGFERTVATAVPPRSQTSDNRPNQDAANMFAGFQVERYNPSTAFQGAQIDLRIVTQFASGLAATNVADQPDAVRAIVNVSGVPIARATLTELTARVRVLSPLIERLSVEQCRTILQNAGQTPSSDQRLLRRQVRNLVETTSSSDLAAFEKVERSILIDTAGG